MGATIKSKYKSSEKIDQRRLRLDILFAGLLMLSILGGIGFVILDLMRNPTNIDNSNNKPILGEVVSHHGNFKTVETENFTLSIPEAWVEVNRPQRIFEEGIRYYPYKYQGTSGDDAGRWVEVYVNKIPNIPVEKVLEISTTEDKIVPGEFSSQCIEFAEYDEDIYNRNADIEAQWRDHTFLCRLSTIGNTIAAIETDMKQGYSFDVGENSKRYLFVYADHGSSEDNELFRIILDSFKPR